MGSTQGLYPRVKNNAETRNADSASPGIPLEPIHTFSNITGIELLDIFNLKTVIIILLTSIGSSFCVLLSLFILKINSNNIKSITLKTILSVSILSSIINSFFSNTIYFLSYENWEIGIQFIQYIIGDLIGTLTVFYILKFSKKMLILKVFSK